MKKISLLFIATFAIIVFLLGCKKEPSESKKTDFTDEQIEALYKELKPLADAILLSENPDWTELVNQYKKRGEVKYIEALNLDFYIEFSNGYTRSWLVSPLSEETKSIKTVQSELKQFEYKQPKSKKNDNPKVALVQCAYMYDNLDPLPSINELSSLFKKYDCKYFPPEKATVDFFKNQMDDYDVIYIHGHGGSNTEFSILVTGEKANSPSGVQHIAHLKSEEYAIDKKGYIAIKGDFITNYCSFSKSPFVYLGCCMLFKRPEQFVKRFIDKGAKVVVGWTDLVRNASHTSGKEILSKMLLNNQNLKQTFDNLPFVYKEDYTDFLFGIKIPMPTKAELKYYGRNVNDPTPGLNKGGDYKLPIPDDGLPPEIHDIIPPEIFEKFEELGIEINAGHNPPNIEGKFKVSPYVLVKSNFKDNYKPGYTFADMLITFSNQNSTNQTVICDYINGNEEGNGLGALISGNGNKFSVFVKTNGTIGGYPYSVVYIYSGEITPTGIKNFYIAGIVTKEAPSSIKVGQGRLIYDKDGFSERVSKGKGSFTNFGQGTNVSHNMARP